MDKTLFYKHHENDIILVQIYVDGIIFGSTNKKPCERFSNLMRNKYEMRMMSELSFFHGLQIHQKSYEIIICQTIPTHTPISISIKLDLDLKGKKVDSTIYRGMVGSLLSLTASRPGIMFATYLCSIYQDDPNE